MLFQDSIKYFEQCNFNIVYLTEDLHASGFEGNIETEHERMFLEQAVKLSFSSLKKSKEDINVLFFIYISRT